MRGSIRLLTVFGISIKIHVTFIVFALFLATGGLKWFVLMIAVFCFVTAHELCHSLAARHFGVEVREITLLPIGGVASMSKMPDEPAQELLIALAGPLFNIAVIVALYFPVKTVFGASVMFHELSTATWPLVAAYAYWINLVLAVFNLIPAFPMDGGRVLRSLLTMKFGPTRSTKIASNIGILFAFVFAYFGIVRFNLILVAIAVFIYVSASNEEAQADLREVLKKIRVRDILSHDFLAVGTDTTLARVLESMVHTRQEDFPVIEGGRLIGFVTRQDIIANLHRFGMTKPVGDIMRRSFPVADEADLLLGAQESMAAAGMKAMPVRRGEEVVGVVALEDIAQVLRIVSERG